MKVTNFTGLGDTKFTWYSLWFCFSGLDHGLRIHGFKPNWPCLIIEGLATRERFFEPFGYCTVNNCFFTICTKCVFHCFHSVMAQFELIKFMNYTTLHVYLCGFQITYKVKQGRMCQYTNYRGTVYCLNFFRYVMYVLQTSTKILPNFWFTLLLISIEFHLCFCFVSVRKADNFFRGSF